MLMPLIAEYDFVVAFKVKLSTPATLIPEALKMFSLKVDIHIQIFNAQKRELRHLRETISRWHRYDEYCI